MQSGNTVSGSYPGNYGLDEVSTCGPHVQWTVNGAASAGAVHLDATSPSPASVTCNGTQYLEPPEISVDVAVACPTSVPSNYSFYTPSPPSAADPVALAAQAPPLSWTRRTYPPAIALTFDIKARKSTVTLTGPPNKTSTISVSLNGNSNVDGSGAPISTNIGTQQNASIDQSGTTSYPLNVDLTSLPYPIRYTSMTATWADESLQFTSIGASRAPDITTLGYTRFSKYNTADEASCNTSSTATANAYVFSGSGCSGGVHPLNARFIQQTSINGGGIPQDAATFNGLILKTYSTATTGKFVTACPQAVWVPSGFTLEQGHGEGNIFVLESPPDEGACSSGLKDATSLAVFPGPNDSAPHWNCSDSVLLVSPGNTVLLKNDGTGNVDLKVVQDRCPECGKQTSYGSNFSNTVAHIDMYTSDPGCGKGSFAGKDWPYYYPIRIK